MEKRFLIIKEWLREWHWFEGLHNTTQTIIMLVLYFLICWGIYKFLKWLIAPVIKHVLSKYQSKFIDLVLNNKVWVHLLQILPGWLFYMLIPTAFDVENNWERYLLRFTIIYIIVVILMVFNSVTGVIVGFSRNRESLAQRPLKIVKQTFQIIFFIIGIILSIAVLFNKPPTALLAGLGASAAILVLVFKDTILGFVSGMQLTLNDMLKLGDWINVDKYNADGVVEEVTLNTVKVRNFDNTMTMVPPYVLVTDSFQNMRWMQLSGVRRISRSVPIDMLTVKFCDDAMIAQMKQLPLFVQMIEQKQLVINNQTYNDTNLGLLRKYLTYYLRQHPNVDHNQTLMVRQMTPTSDGLPIEIYCFSALAEWVPYESVQSELLEHVTAVVPYFSLRIFERNSTVGTAVSPTIPPEIAPPSVSSN